MLIQRREKDNKGMFYVEIDGEVQAEMTYHMTSPDKMIIEHTEVDDKLRGHNGGYQLVEAAVNYAREHNIKIIAWCPFAKKVFEKKPAWSDVLDT
ncbi:MAG TPA: GNAT family N-acetyltransferase [Chitinophagaceae bacterium]|nr:GNAT family N-acetyltransferase [Chitinophagaceae bacterium]